MVDENTKGVVTPSQIISVEQAIEMKDFYQDSIGILIKKNNSTLTKEYDPTLFAYIELDSIRQYIAYLDEVERLNKQKISGLRVYFAAYPDTLKNRSKPQVYRKRETFFFAPTIEVKPNEWGRAYPNLRNVPFYIQSTNDNKLVGEFIVIDGLLCKNDSRPANAKRSDSVSNQAGKTSLILNDMQLTPPPKE